MNFGFSDRQNELRKAAYDTAALLPSAPFADRWKTAGAAGLTGLPVPGGSGGPGLGALETAISLEGFSEGCTDGGFTFSLAAHLFAGTVPLVKHGSGALRKRILPRVAAGEFILANAMTEPGSGSDAFALKTTATADGDEFILRGSKIFCTNAPVADGILVYALTDPAKGFFGGISCFLLEREKHTYKVGEPIRKTGLHASPLAEVFLDGVRVHKENLVGKAGAGVMIFHESMNWERAGMSAMHVGTMTRLCAKTRDYVKARQTDKHQAVQFRIAEMFLQTEIARLLAYRAAKLIDDGKDATTAAAKAKIVSSEALHFVAREAMLLHGANGFTEDYGLGQVLADAQAAAIYSGPNDVLRGLVASRL